MPIDLLNYIDIGFGLIMLTSAYIIYRVAIKINYHITAINDASIETNKALLDSIKSCDIDTLHALNRSIELLQLHIDKVDLLVTQFLAKEQVVVEERKRMLEKQDGILDRQVAVLEKQEAISEIVKVIKDEIIEKKRDQ